MIIRVVKASESHRSQGFYVLLLLPLQNLRHTTVNYFRERGSHWERSISQHVTLP